VANFSKPSPTSNSSLSLAALFFGLAPPALSLRALSSFSAVCFDSSIAFLISSSSSPFAALFLVLVAPVSELLAGAAPD